MNFDLDEALSAIKSGIRGMFVVTNNTMKYLTVIDKDSTDSLGYIEIPEEHIELFKKERIKRKLKGLT
jgi:hypothetical protein